MSKRISLRLDGQGADNWCWAAVAVGLARYWHVTKRWRQCALVKDVFAQARNNNQAGADDLPSGSCCVTPIPEDYDQVWYLGNALDVVGVPHQWVGKPLSFPDLKVQIDALKPVCALINWASGGSHYIAITDCYERDGVQQVHVEDSQNGPSDPPYSTLNGTYQVDGQWAETILLN